ncbi:ABC transporter substrate-binding protein [Hymenobacter armeniacus]|uniref:ABC transporter substrate-binding protein n=1 Tax=Hymenobacter armeniacus TaxID=2771358 RepID=UPI00293BCDE5|nr:ABC transporter substrate-binding protein [Hymenobacter armeniacus]
MKHPLPANFLLRIAIALLACSCGGQHAQRDTVRIRWARDPETLDPLFAPNLAAFDANNLLHVSLLQGDIATQQLAPALAEQLPTVQLVGDSLTRLQYRIRPAATWDNGRAVLASDVDFTLKLMLCPGLPNEAARNQYSFIRAVLPHPQDPRRFTLLCRGQSLEFAQASGDFFILPEHSLDPRGLLRRWSLADLQRQPLPLPADSGARAVAQQYLAAVASRSSNRLSGCGPYELLKWEKDRFLSFRRKPRWWGSRLQPAPLVLQARPQQLEYVIIPDVATAALALQRGDVDVFPQMPAREFARLRAAPAARSALRFYTSPSYDVATAGFNTRHPALADALTRRALSRCFDAAGLLRATQLGEGQRTVGIISPADRANYNDSLAPVPFAPDSAVALLRRAGWQRRSAPHEGWFRSTGRGADQQLRLLVRYRAEEVLFGTVALQFQAAAASIGVPVTLRPTEPGTFATAMRSGDFDVYLRVLRGNPFMFNFTQLLHSASANNVTKFGTPASDRLIAAIARADNPARRTALLRQFQALLQAEAPIVPLFYLPNRVAANRALTGLHVGSLRPGFAAATIERVAQPAP